MAIPEPITGQERGHSGWPGLGLVLHPCGWQRVRRLGESSIRKLWKRGMVPKDKAGATTRKTMEKCVGRTQNKVKPAIPTQAKLYQKKEI